MSLLIIPIDSALPTFDFRIDLEDVTYIFFFSWNTRAEMWHFSISDQDGVDIINGQPVLLNVDCLGRFELPALPPGQLFFMDTRGEQQAPTRDTLGKRVVCLYNESEA